jgi:23S rRNA pseudouridine1911/1915/1917 synthase
MRLGFTHPGSGEYVEYTSAYPEDLDHALDQLADTQ